MELRTCCRKQGGAEQPNTVEVSDSDPLAETNEKSSCTGAKGWGGGGSGEGRRRRQEKEEQQDHRRRRKNNKFMVCGSQLVYQYIFH